VARRLSRATDSSAGPNGSGSLARLAIPGRSSLYSSSLHVSEVRPFPNSWFGSWPTSWNPVLA
jgi:hypothetical protein